MKRLRFPLKTTAAAAALKQKLLRSSSSPSQTPTLSSTCCCYLSLAYQTRTYLLSAGRFLLLFPSPNLENKLVEKGFSFAHLFHVFEALILGVLGSEVAKGRLPVEANLLQKTPKLLFLLLELVALLSPLLLSPFFHILVKYLLSLFGREKQVARIENDLGQLFFPRAKCRDLK